MFISSLYCEKFCHKIVNVNLNKSSMYFNFATSLKSNCIKNLMIILIKSHFSLLMRKGFYMPCSIVFNIIRIHFFVFLI